MEEESFMRLREIILSSYEIEAESISFNTFKALEKGYNEDEIAIADSILLANPTKSDNTVRLKNDIRYLFDDENYNPVVYYIGIAKIVFIIDKENDFYTHVFEEVLANEVAQKRNVEEYFKYFMDFILATKKNDAYGNPI